VHDRESRQEVLWPPQLGSTMPVITVTDRTRQQVTWSWTLLIGQIEPIAPSPPENETSTAANAVEFSESIDR